jgi:hypothetical protein
MPEPYTVRDQLGTPHLPSLRRIAVKVVDRVQHERASDQLNATAIALVAMSDAAGLDPFEVLCIAKRVMHAAEGPFTHQIQAIRDYAKSELRGRP